MGDLTGWKWEVPSGGPTEVSAQSGKIEGNGLHHGQGPLPSHPSLPPKPVFAISPSTSSVKDISRVSPWHDEPSGMASPSLTREPSRRMSRSPASTTAGSEDLSQGRQDSLGVGTPRLGEQPNRRVVSDLPQRAKRMGGPPKAILGGVGGKTFEERQRTQSLSPSTQPTTTHDVPSHQVTPSSLPPKPLDTKWKGPKVAIKLPPQNYSPPETPDAAQTPISPHDAGDDEKGEATPKRPRKAAYPWPKHQKVLSSSSSNNDAPPRRKNMGTVRRSKAPIVDESAEASGASWRGKEVLVGFPREDAWGSLFASAEKAKKEREYQNVPATSVVADEKSSQSTSDPPGSTRTDSSIDNDSEEGQKTVGRLHNSAYLKRSLGGVLRESPLRESRASQRRAVSDIFAIQSEGELTGGAEGYTGGPGPGAMTTDRPDTQRNREGAPSPEFEEVPLSASGDGAPVIVQPGQGGDDAGTTADSLDDKLRPLTTSEEDEAKTITPSESKRFEELLQQGPQDTLPVTEELEAGSKDTDPAPIPPLAHGTMGGGGSQDEGSQSRRLRFDAPTFRPTSTRHTSVSSIGSNPSMFSGSGDHKRLRPDANAFVPSQRAGASPPQVVEDSTGRRKTLRASAATFQPSFHVGHSTPTGSFSSTAHAKSSAHPADVSGHRSASPTGSTFSFRPTAAPWVPPTETSHVNSASSSSHTHEPSDTENDRSFETSGTSDMGVISPAKRVQPLSPAKLHASATPFVPSQPIGPTPSISDVRPTSSDSGGRQFHEGSHERHRPLEVQKAILRPTATTFVPSFGDAAVTFPVSSSQQLMQKDPTPATSSNVPALRPSAADFVPLHTKVNDSRPTATTTSTENSPTRPDMASQTASTTTPTRARADTVAFGAQPNLGAPDFDSSRASTNQNAIPGPSPSESPATLLHKLGTVPLSPRAVDMALNADDAGDPTADLPKEPEGKSDATSPMHGAARRDQGHMHLQNAHINRQQASSRGTDNAWEEAMSDNDEAVSRAHHLDRPTSARSDENSYLASAFTTLPKLDSDYGATDVTIHPSHPFRTPLGPSRQQDISPDVPRSAHTQAASQTEGLPTPLRAPPPQPTLQPSRPKGTPSPAPTSVSNVPPLSALPGHASFGVPSNNDPFVHTVPALGQAAASPASQYSNNTPTERGVRSNTPSRSTKRHTSTATTNPNDTFTTADGSPLLPSRNLLGTLTHPASPTPLHSTPDAPLASDSYRPPVPPRPEIRVGLADDQRRFREWVFPLHANRPSISRRHTIPLGSSPDADLDAQGSSAGVASTTYGRVFDPRSPDGTKHFNTLSEPGDIGRPAPEPQTRREREASVEFPLRTQNGLLKVVNGVASPVSEGALSPGGVQDEPQVSQWSEIKSLLSRLEDRLHSLNARTISDGPADGPPGIGKPPSGANRDALDALRSLLDRNIDAIQNHSTLLQSRRASGDVTPWSDSDLEERTPIASHRHYEMLQAMLTGQHAMLDRVTEFAEDREQTKRAIDAINHNNNHLQAQLVKQRSWEADIEDLRRQLAESQHQLQTTTATVAEARADAEVYKHRLEDARKERDALREDLAQKAEQLDAVDMRGRDLVAENDKLLAMRLAAELERDSLSKSLLDVREEFERMFADLEASRLESSRLEKEKEELKLDLRARVQRQDTARGEEMAGMREATKDLQLSLLSRLAEMENGMRDATGVRSEAYDRAVDQSKSLQAEVYALQQKIAQLESSTEKHASVQSTLSAALAATQAERDALSKQLKMETDRRMQAEDRASSLESQLEHRRKEVLEAKTIATERQAFARMSEVRLQTLTQEAVYWRQFALEADRRKYRSYMASNPFHGSSSQQPPDSQPQSQPQETPPDAHIQTPNDAQPANGTGEDVARMTGRAGNKQEPKTPTQMGKRPVHPLANSISASSELGGDVKEEHDDEGRWYGLAT